MTTGDSSFTPLFSTKVEYFITNNKVWKYLGIYMSHDCYTLHPGSFRLKTRFRPSKVYVWVRLYFGYCVLVVPYRTSLTFPFWHPLFHQSPTSFILPRGIVHYFIIFGKLIRDLRISLNRFGRKRSSSESRKWKGRLFCLGEVTLLNLQFTCVYIM